MTLQTLLTLLFLSAAHARINPFTSTSPFGGTPVPDVSFSGGGSESNGVLTLFLNAGGGGVSTVGNRQMDKGEGACARLRFPGTDYGGVSMTFYTLEIRHQSWNDKKSDEIDIEFIGSPQKFQSNFFVKGVGGRETNHAAIGNDHRICLGNEGDKVVWYLNGELIRTMPVTITKTWPWFSVWETAGIWDCCGPRTAPNFKMEILEFTMYTSIRISQPLPASTVTATSNQRCGVISPGLTAMCAPGLCCSYASYCGSEAEWCGAGCQIQYGSKCGITASASATKKTVGRNERCGVLNENTIGTCGDGLCCSYASWCGSEEDWCGVGCQKEFGSKCWADGGQAPVTTSSSTTVKGGGSTATNANDGTCADRWGQCGGKDWKGPTSCCGGYKCTFSNEYYSQCL